MKYKPAKKFEPVQKPAAKKYGAHKAAQAATRERLKNKLGV